MKTTFFLTILLFFCSFGALRAQTGVIITGAGKGVPVQTDTIAPLQRLCLDTTIASFRVTVFKGNVGMEKRSNGYCCMLPFMAESGSTIYVTEIVSYPQPGVKVRLPDRQYYVR